MCLITHSSSFLTSVNIVGGPYCTSSGCQFRSHRVVLASVGEWCGSDCEKQCTPDFSHQTPGYNTTFKHSILILVDIHIKNQCVLIISMVVQRIGTNTLHSIKAFVFCIGVESGATLCQRGRSFWDMLLLASERSRSYCQVEGRLHTYIHCTPLYNLSLSLGMCRMEKYRLITRQEKRSDFSGPGSLHSR